MLETSGTKNSKYKNSKYQIPKEHQLLVRCGVYFKGSMVGRKSFQEATTLVAEDEADALGDSVVFEG